MSFASTISGLPGLQANWKHDEAGGASTLVDAQGSFNATVTSITFGAGSLVPDDGGSAGTYNGTSSRGTLASSSVFNYERTQAFSFQCVRTLNVTRSGVDTEYVGISKVSTSSPFPGWEFSIAWNATKTVLRCRLINNFGGGNHINVESTTDIPNGIPAHFVWTYSGNSNASGVNFYVNGVLQSKLVNTNALSASILSSVAPTIGSRQASKYFNGVTDEDAFFNTELSQANVTALYNAWNSRTLAAIPTRPYIILTTDLASDIDDVGDLSVLHALADNGECTLAAVITDSANLYSAPTAKAINTYYRRNALLVGAHQGSDPAGVPSSSTYTQTIRDEFGTASDTRANYDSAATAFRKALAGCPDGQAVIVATGFATGLAALLSSSADSISALTGIQLVTAKVSHLVCVAGIYPNDSGSAEWNFQQDPANWATVINTWPTPKVFAGIELVGVTAPFTILTGPPSSADPGENPVKRAFDLNSAQLTAGERAAWGQLGVLYAVRGLSTWFTVGGKGGKVTINSSTGVASWAINPANNDTFLRKSAADATFKSALNALLAQSQLSQKGHALASAVIAA